MAYEKGKQVEQGIWFVKGYERKRDKIYWAEVWLRDPVTGMRIKESKVSNRLDTLRDWRWKRKNAQTSGELAKERSQKQVVFSQLADEYFAEWSTKRNPSTVAGEKTRIEGVLKPYFGKKVITSITRKDIEEFIRKRRDGSLNGIVALGVNYKREGGVSLATTNRDLCRLKNIFKKAVEWNYLESNPALGIPQEKEPTPETNYLEREEVAAFFLAAEPNYLPLFKTAVYTGLRFGELRKLEWRDINWEFGTVRVRKPKNKEERHVPIVDPVREVFEDLVSGELRARKDWQQVLRTSHDPVFTNPETGKPFVSVRKALKRALDRAGIEKTIRFHDLRHTTGSHLAMNGSTEVEIAQFLGHKDTTVTRRYTHLSKPHLRAVADRLNFDEKPEGGGDKEVG